MSEFKHLPIQFPKKSLVPPATSAGKSARKTWLINPRFQLSFMGWMVTMALLVVGIFYGSIWFFFWKFRQLAEQAGLPTNHVMFEFLGEQQSQMDWIFGVTAVLTVVFVVIGAYLFSHRVSGPIHRLKKHMDGILDGSVKDEVKFRKKDYFQELAESCNALFAIVKKARKKPSPTQMSVSRFR